jgi:hypothetical protein
MANKSLTIIAAISVIGLLFLVYLAATFESPERSSTVELERPIPRAPEPIERAPVPVSQPEPEPQVEVADQQIVETPETPVEPMPELPSLNESDSFVLPRLAALETGESLMRVLATEDLIRKFVVFTDNIASGNLPQMEYPVQRMTTEMRVTALDDNLYVMDPASFQRFNPIIDTFIAVDVQSGLALFRMTGPLFQEAFAELGYGERSFNTVLLAAIDNVLNARTVEGPFQLVKPSVMYLYAEQGIEDMSPVEKQLIRIGPDNTRKLKEKLTEYRARLAAGR